MFFLFWGEGSLIFSGGGGELGGRGRGGGGVLDEVVKSLISRQIS